MRPSTPSQATPPTTASNGPPTSPSIVRLFATEAWLFLREPIALIFVFAFPALTVLVLGGVFDPEDQTFAGVAPSDYYIAAYFGVVLAAVGFVMLPALCAAYREHGVLRRFHTTGFPPWALPMAWFGVAALLSFGGFVVLLVTAQLSYGIPAIQNPGRTGVAVLLSMLVYINLGLLLGLLIRTARAAQGMGLTLFFPSFLVGGAGPPPDAMPDLMHAVSQLLPMTYVVQAIQRPWLGIAGGGHDLVVLLVLGLVTTIGWVVLADRASRE